MNLLVSAHRCVQARPVQAGFTLVEVLVTVVILAVGLLGLASLQGRANLTQMEAYQRSTALALVKDMGSRVPAAREDLDDFRIVFGNQVLGMDGNPPACGAGTGAARHRCEWHRALSGVGTEAAGQNIAAPIGIRGCVLEVAPPTNALAEFLVVAVWQGLTPTASPPAGSPGADCAPDVEFGEGLRRAVVTRVLIPRLTGT